MAFICFYDFPYVGNVIIPIDKLIFFRGVESTNQFCFGMAAAQQLIFFGCVRDAESRASWLIPQR